MKTVLIFKRFPKINAGGYIVRHRGKLSIRLCDSVEPIGSRWKVVRNWARYRPGDENLYSTLKELRENKTNP